jgi:hypothetical protein
MNPQRASADVLLMLDADDRRDAAAIAADSQKAAAKFRFTGDSLGFLSGLMSGKLVEMTYRYSGANPWGAGIPSFEVQLTARGRSLVEAWKAGNPAQLRSALGYTDADDVARSNAAESC